jgi:hypothetical protein
MEVVQHKYHKWFFLLNHFTLGFELADELAQAVKEQP